MTEGKVETIIKEGIATVQFFHPQSNSLPGSLLMNLAAEIEKAGKDKQAKVIVLKSEGEKAFCAGASFDELMAIKDLETGKKFFSGFAAVINAMRKANKFVIARVQGKAVGGGVGLAAAADYTLATDAASAKLSELNLGIGPFVVGPAVERKIGTSAFAQMSINASEWMNAQWCKEKGLYQDIFPTIIELDKAVNEFAAKLAAGSPEAMAQLKEVLWEGTGHWDKLLSERAAMSGRLVLSDFTKKFIENFKQEHDNQMPYKEKEIVKVYHNIREVADMFKVAPSLLRFWEKEFPTQLQPTKDNRGNRLYTEKDITNIRILHDLIKVQGFTLDGAKKHFRENKKENTEQEKALKSLQRIKDELLALKKELSA